MRVRKEETGNWRSLAKTVAVSAAIGLVTSAALLFLAAALMTVWDLPEGAVSPIAVSALGIGAWVAGLLAAKRTGKNGMAVGALCGCLLFGLALIAGLSVFGKVQIGFTLFKLAVSVLCGAIGGILGVGGKRR